MGVKTVGVLGAGSMGKGISQVAAQSGCQVLLADLDPGIVEKSIADIGNQLAKLVSKGKMAESEREATLGKIKAVKSIDDLGGAGIVIEAIIEDESVKKDAFVKLDQVCSPGAILASNTSSISITSIASATKRPDKVVGTHFFFPVPLMRLVEVIRGYYTSDETVSTAVDLVKGFGKTPVVVKKDTPGFIVNRLMFAQYVEAMKLVEEGVAGMEDVDTAMKLGLNHPMGPFELHDFTGTDIGYYSLLYLAREYQEARWNPPYSLKTLMRSRRLGRKTKAGWYNY
jgi:3-hydroxybutyryl-CoA dehydrogenase